MTMNSVIIPDKLNKGDEIRVIAPSQSMCLLSEETIAIAKQRLEALGFRVTFGKHVFQQIDENYACASIAERVADLHDAFADPKIICGFSDITALLNAIYAKTGLITYYGPHFSSFGMKHGFDYTLAYFKRMLMERELVTVTDSEQWSDDSWYIHQE